MAANVTDRLWSIEELVDRTSSRERDMSASKRMALGRRAVGTAVWLKVWAETIEDEVKKQGLSLQDEGKPIFASDMNDPTPVTLTLGQLRALVCGMQERMGEIQRFSN
jgi:hypothetical protein